MGKYLKKFETQAAYNAAKPSLILPNVSLIEETTAVEYNPHIDPYNGHEYVDLDLPSGTLWATMNVGATGITDYGNYYQYGKGAAQYATTSGDSIYSGTENPLATSADTAAQVWGGNWHMPTQAQLNELKENTTYSWVTINGVNGGKFTAQNGNYIFIPAAGFYSDGSIYRLGERSSIWSSTPSGGESAYYLSFYQSGKGVTTTALIFGYLVRGVVG